MAKLCSICGGKNYAKGFCNIHYKMPSQINPKPLEKPKKPIRIISKKMTDNLKEYRRKRDLYLTDNPTCEFNGCGSSLVELHHKKSRKYYLSDSSVFMSVCRKHHNWIHDNDAEARELGYLLNSI